MSSQRHALHSSVVSCLTSIIGGHGRERKSAEDELKALEVTDDFGLVLVGITASADSPLEFRQLASILLKQYVETHWSRDLDKFEEPEPSDQVKDEIRKLLPVCLRAPQSKVRSTVAYAISAIASLDWPDQWGNLFDELIYALSSGEIDLVHGAMRVLSEFCHEVSDVQVPQVAPVILPCLLKVIVQTETYSVRTRSRAVHIFNTLASLVYGMTGRYQDAPDTLLFPILPEYLTTFVELLGNSNHGNDDPGLRREIIMALCQLLQYFPRPLTPHIMTLVTPIWNILLSSAQSYVSGVVNCIDTLDAVCDSDGEVIGQEITIFAIFEFVSALSESSFARRLLPPILPELVYYLIAYMQITEEQVGTWSEDVTRFVEEDENEFSYSVRLSALDLLLGICESPKLGGACCLAITTAVEKHLQESPLSSSAVAWKVHEACMLASSCALQAVSLGMGAFDCQMFADRVVLPALTSNNSSFLTGRCLWLASKMGHTLRKETLVQLLEMVASGLRPPQPHVVRVLSAKATFYFCSELKSTEHAQFLSPFLPHYLRSLSEMAGEFSDDVVSLAVDSLQLVAQIDPAVTAQCADQLVPIATSLFLKFAHDPSVSMSVEELFQSLAHNPSCHGYLHSRFLPTAIEILQSGGNQLPLGLVPAVLDVLVHIIRGGGANSGPLVTDVFPVVIQRILTSDDSAILQNGGECVRAYVSTCMEQLAAWHDSRGCSGLEYVVKVILHLLDPTGPEFSASFVGKLIIAFVKKAGSVLGEHLELLLRSVLSKMQSATSLTVMQSLLVVFACLMQTELESVVTFLSQVPDPTGQPALNFVMKEWLTIHSSFYGGFEPRMSSLALAKVLTHTLATNDQRLAGISVRGEEVCPAGVTGIITRSRKSQMPVEWSEVPLVVKIFKLLVGDIANGLEIEQPESADGSDEEGEDIETTLDSLLNHSYPSYEIEQDPDLLDEPVLQLDMQGYLVSYLSELSRQPCFSSIQPHLTREETDTLARAGVTLQ